VWAPVGASTYGAPPVKVVGLTGGIGAGKSTVSALLAARGAVVVDADAVVRELQVKGMPVFEAIVERFGSGVVGSDGELDRPALAAVVFDDPQALADLNGLVHPAVGAEILRRVAEHEGTDRVVVLDVPLLVESGRYRAAGVIVVDAPLEVAVERLARDRGMTAEEARARMSRQASRDERLAKADLVIDNSGPPEALDEAVDRAWAWIATLPEEPAAP
jgi:dephospho-CoA kinase